MHATSTSRIGACTWSLRATDLDHTLAMIRTNIGVSAVQLALDPIIDAGLPTERVQASLEQHGIRAVSAMMAPVGEDYSTPDSIRRTGGFLPDSTWDDNRRRAALIARAAHKLGIPLVTFHAGSFLRPDDTLSTHMLERVRTITDIFNDLDIRVALETGHEPATHTMDMLDALGRDGAGVNFDPANIILYDRGDPSEALATLMPRVVQCHVKDARPPAHAGEWGTEVPVGSGDVDWNDIFAQLDKADRCIDLLVERESGDARVADICTAIALVRSIAPGRYA
ncbi:MAG: sugar phosphate isomerase/epimerase [Phycisphaerales bacterium]